MCLTFSNAKVSVNLAWTVWRRRIWLPTAHICGQHTASEVCGHPETRRPTNTNSSRLCCLLCSRQKLLTDDVRVLSVTAASFGKHLKTHMFSRTVLAHLRIICFALHKCTLYYYCYYLTPVLNSQGMKKLRYTIQKSTKMKLEWTIIIITFKPTSTKPQAEKLG